MAIALTIGGGGLRADLVFGYPDSAFLRRAGLGKQVRGEGPSSHLWKTGTPTLGGLLFVASILALTGILTLTLYRDSGRSILLPTTVMLLVATLGAYDDKLSLVGSAGGGLPAGSGPARSTHTHWFAQRRLLQAWAQSSTPYVRRSRCVRYSSRLVFANDRLTLLVLSNMPACCRSASHARVTLSSGS